jgi:hypothetical protein
MDVNRLQSLLTELTGTEIGLKWMKISMDMEVRHFLPLMI